MDEQGHLKKKLEFSEARFEAIAQTATDSIIISDENSLIVFANNKTYEMFGYLENELIGLNLHVLMPEKYRRSHQSGFERFIHTGIPKLIGHTVEIEGLRKDGSVFPLELSLSCWMEEKHYFFSGIIRDITIRKQQERVLQETNEELATALEELRSTEEQLIDLNDELEKRVEERTERLETQTTELMRVNTDLDNFIYTASHDLKSPIANIEGLLTMLRKETQGQLNSSAEKVISMIEQSTIKFKKTIFDLTEISKVQKNTEEDIEEVQFEAVLEDVKADLQTVINQAGVSIREDLQVESLLYARGNLRSILYNLLSNAIKYRSHERPPLILISTFKTEAFVVLQVKDNGLGLSSYQQAKVFQMFKRLHSHVEGTGIGLYIIKRIVENNGGSIEIESMPDQGTTFSIYFKI